MGQGKSPPSSTTSPGDPSSSSSAMNWTGGQAPIQSPSPIASSPGGSLSPHALPPLFAPSRKAPTSASCLGSGDLPVLGLADWCVPQPVDAINAALSSQPDPGTLTPRTPPATFMPIQSSNDPLLNPRPGSAEGTTTPTSQPSWGSSPGRDTFSPVESPPERLKMLAVKRSRGPQIATKVSHTYPPCNPSPSPPIMQPGTMVKDSQESPPLSLPLLSLEGGDPPPRRAG